MAEQLIGSMADKWEPEEWKDEYREGLLKLIEEKVAAPGKEVKSAKATRPATNVVDLVSVLQESLKAHAKAGTKGKKRTLGRALTGQRKAA
jgi:DNA end-binding protein Ku